MRFTDIFVRRPVLATVVSLLILLIGLNALRELQVRQYPELQNSIITITTIYPGASSDRVRGFITTPVQQAVASAEGIDYLKSTSKQGISTVSVHLQLGYDANKAMTEVLAKVAQARKELPGNAEEPVISKSTGGTTSLLYLSFFSEHMGEAQISDYLKRVVQPQLQTLEGVASAAILGEKAFALRVWLNPQKLAAYNLTPQDVAQAINANSYLAAAGETKGLMLSFNVQVDTDLQRPDEFRQLVIKRDDGALVRLGDVASVEMGAENDDSAVYFNGKRAVFVAIDAQPAANPLQVIDRVYAKLPAIERQLPDVLKAKVAYDATRFIRNSIEEVVKTVAEATLIVILVIFLFLGSVRSVLIPVVTIPLSLIGVCFFMLVLGYSINLLTLLAMVLAIGLVVDDAIVVVENIHRHIEEGLSPFDAALKGAREIAMPVISMTLTLATVYVPIGFMGGLTGGLFKEFAFALAGAVIISGVIALTLSPMMCAKLLTSHSSAFAKRLDRLFDALRRRYQRRLHATLEYTPVTLFMAVTLLVSCGFLYQVSNKELAREEDQGIIFSLSSAPANATKDYVQAYIPSLLAQIDSFPQKSDSFVVAGMEGVNSLFSGMLLTPWSERSQTQMELVPQMQAKLGQIAGFESVSFNLPTLPGATGMPIQFVLTSAQDHEVLYELGQELLGKAMASGYFMFLTTDLKFDRQVAKIEIDKPKAAELGISMQEIGAALSTLLGGGSVNRFNVDGRSYDIIPQVAQDYRRTKEQLGQYQVRTGSGELVPLATVARLSHSVEPTQRGQFQQLNAMMLEGVMMPGVSTGDALAVLNRLAQETLPKDTGIDYAGASRQFMQEGNALLFTFFFALIMIYLVLAAQFESFRDPLIILITVPLSLMGALLPIALGVTSINIFTQVGLVTLIGLISKHGILIVEFANQLQRNEGLGKREAVEKAAGMRLRAILMTTAAMVVGVIPLIMAQGAGAASRFDIGLVVASGLSVGTLFTLFVVPAMYLRLGQAKSALRP